jgi:predicted component of type VI protein secretion system
MEYVKSAGATNEPGATDTAYHEGLDLYWQQYYSSAIPKFEEVKRLFPQHSEVDRLIQSSQQAKAEGKERSSFPLWIVGVILGVLFILLLVIIIIAVIVLMMRRKKKSSAPGGAGAGKGHHAPSPAATPSPAVAHSAHPAPPPAPSRPAPPPPPPPAPMPMGGDQGMTVDLSRTVAITADMDGFGKSYGSIQFVSGPLSGQKFQIKADGDYIGRDGGSSQIVIGDPRISKRHVWIGVKNGRVVIEDQNSRNGTFVNDPKSARVTEAPLNIGDTVILGESDVARFEFHA